MFGDNPFAIPISSFQRPVPLVLVDPDDEPDYNVCFRKEWLPYILGALQQLWLQTTWDTDDPDALALEQERAKLLTMLFSQGCEVCTADNPTNSGCVSFPTDSSIITYAPQNPFTQPDYIPPGYIAVPFLVIRPGDVLSFFPGAQVGDVITGWLSLPVLTPGIGQGLARFRVHVKGTGVVELHLLRFPGAGAVLITNDDDPLTVRTINLNKDIVQLPVETVGEVVVEVPIETDGEHHIDVTFVPRFNDEPIFLSYGGGVRSVVLCGFDQTVQEIVDDQARNGVISVEEGDDMAIRISPDDPCILQRECSPGEWVDWYNPFACGIPSAQPGSGAHAPQPGDCATYHANMPGNGRWLLPIGVSEGDVITISAATGATYDPADAFWRCPNGQQFFLNACVGLTTTDAGNPAPTVPQGRLIVNIDGVYYDAYNQEITVPGGVSNGQVEFIVNYEDNSDSTGSVTFDVEVCNNAAVFFEHVFDFTVTDGGFERGWPGGAQDNASFTAGEGWRGGAGAGDGFDLFMTRYFSERKITSIEFFVSFDVLNTARNSQAVFGSTTGTYFTGDDADHNTDTPIAPDVVGSISLIVGSGGNDDPEGNFTVTKIIVRGEGTDPF